AFARSSGVLYVIKMFLSITILILLNDAKMQRIFDICKCFDDKITQKKAKPQRFSPFYLFFL
ncbi:MAG: hypothetical protein IKT22_09470, partial [Prevotella sp.]|nr:hypothetical protein [Prevotella sp.]